MSINLSAAGALLYGERWQAPLARALGVSRRTVVNWAEGDHPVPESAETRLCELLSARMLAINTLLNAAGR